MWRTNEIRMTKQIILAGLVVCCSLASQQVMGEQELTTSPAPTAISTGQNDSPATSVIFTLSQTIAYDYYTGATIVPELGFVLESKVFGSVLGPAELKDMLKSTTSGPHIEFIEQTPDTPAAKTALHALIRKFQAVEIGIATEHIWQRPDCIFPLLVHLRYPDKQIGQYGRQLFLKNAGKVLEPWLIQSGLSGSDPTSTTVPAQVWASLEAEPLEVCWRGIYLAELFPNTRMAISAALEIAHTLATQEKAREALYYLKGLHENGLQKAFAAQVMYEIAYLYGELGEPDRSLEALEDIEIFHPQSDLAPQAMEKAAKTEHLLGQDHTAFIRLHRLASLYPAYQITDPKLQLIRKNHLQALDEEIRSLQAIIDGHKDGDQEAALGELSDLIRSMPLSARLYEQIAASNVGTNLGSLAEALWAEVLFKQGQSQRATELAEQIIQQEDIWPETKLIAHQTLGDILRSQGNFSQALSHYSSSCIFIPEEHPLRQAGLVPSQQLADWEQLDNTQLQIYCEVLRACLLIARDQKHEAARSLQYARGLWQEHPARASNSEVLDNVDLLLLFCNVELQRYGRSGESALTLAKQLTGIPTDSRAQFVRKLLELRKTGINYLGRLSTYKSALQAGKELPEVQSEAVSFYNFMARNITVTEKLSFRDRFLADLLVSALRGGMLQDASYRLRELLSSWPDSPDVLKLLDALHIVWFGQVDRLEQLLEKRTQLPETMQTKASLVDLAQLALKVNQTRLADNLLEKAAETADVQTLQAIAKIYLGFNRYADGIECYRRILAKYTDDPRCPDIKLGVAKLYAEQWKLYPQAIKECEELIEQFEQTPQAMEAAFMIGRICYTNQQYQAAVDRLTHFVQQYPDHQLAVQAKLLRGLSYLADGNSEQAVKGFGELVGEHPEDPAAAQAQFLIGYTYLSEQKYNLAAEELQRLLDRYPKCRYAARAKELIQRLSNIKQTSPGD